MVDDSGPLLDPASVAIWSAFVLTVLVFFGRSSSLNVELYVFIIAIVVVVVLGYNQFRYNG